MVAIAPDNDIARALQEELGEQDAYQQADLAGLEEDETIDLLDNLGYVFFEQGPMGNKPGKDDIITGIARFRAELQESLLLQYPGLQGYLQDIATTPVTASKLSDAEIELLTIFSDLENEPASLEAEGIEGIELAAYDFEVLKQDKVLTRILNFRLSLLHLITTRFRPTPTYSSNISKPAFDNLKVLLGTDNEQEVLQFTDNFHTLIDRAAAQITYPSIGGDESDAFQNLIFFTAAKGDLDNVDFESDDNIFGRLPGLPEEDAAYYQGLIDKGFITSFYRHAKKIEETTANRFLIRLVQLKLWLLGLYEGRLDSEMGNLSLKAILDVKTLNDELAKDEGQEVKQTLIDPKSYLYYIGRKRVWAINYHQLLQQVLPAFERVYGRRDVVQQMGVHLNQLIEQANTPEKEADLEEGFTRAWEEYQQKKRRKKKRRRGLLGGIGRFFARVGKWLVEGVKKIAQAVYKFFKLIKNGILWLLREIKEAIARIYRGLRFFFSKRIVQTTDATGQVVVSSDFDFDFDVASQLNSSATANSLQAHAVALQQSAADYAYALNFFAEAIPILLQLGSFPLGWLKAGIKLVKLLFGNSKLVKLLP